jgi:predicted RNase H-like HicB family nuclease
MAEKNIKEVWKEFISEEAKSSASLPSFPAKQLKINHDEAV